MPRAATRKTQEVLDMVLLLRLSYASGRDILNGVSSAARRAGWPWRFHVVNFDAASRVAEINDALRSRVDGVIAIGFYEREIVDAFSSFNGPLVIIGLNDTEIMASRTGATAFVNSDDEMIGRVGAKYLESLGRFRSYGFLKAGCRANGFIAHFAALGREVPVFQPDHTGPIVPEVLRDWLAALPKPAAIMAPTDAVAIFALEAAAKARVKVPKDLVVLGVDNDSLLCETSEPPLSSVVVDHQKFGAMAAEALHRLIGSSGPRRFSTVLQPDGIEERQSTRPVPPGVALAERAAAFIKRNAVAGVGAADVAAHLGVSRSLADLRFRQVHGESMLSMIQRCRLEALCRKLRDTDLPIGQATKSCGFADPDHARRVFRSAYGCTMRQWRAAHAGG